MAKPDQKRGCAGGQDGKKKSGKRAPQKHGGAKRPTSHSGVRLSKQQWEQRIAAAVQKAVEPLKAKIANQDSHIAAFQTEPNPGQEGQSCLQSQIAQKDVEIATLQMQVEGAQLLLRQAFVQHQDASDSLQRQVSEQGLLIDALRSEIQQLQAANSKLSDLSIRYQDKASWLELELKDMRRPAA